MSDKTYTPIDCSLHDRLESAATLRQTVRIIYLGSNGERIETNDRLVDVFAKDGKEFIKTEGGILVRLDQLISVDGVEFK